MLRRTLLVALVVLAAACPRSREPAHESREAAHESHETASARADLAHAASPLSCRALDECTGACADAACAEACVRRLTAAARPAYDALQACVVPACANADAGNTPCRAPGSLACKMCVLAHCPTQASSCMTH